MLCLVVGCGGAPIARNVPAPNKAAAAGIAAGAAAAITLADPQGAAARQEELKPDDNKQPQKSKGTVPVDVLDRLDEKQRHDAARPPGEHVPAGEP
jgi:hypothetical protein